MRDEYIFYCYFIAHLPNGKKSNQMLDYNNNVLDLNAKHVCTVEINNTI